MSTAYGAIDAAIREVAIARHRIPKVKTNQVRGIDDVAMLKAIADTWFHTHRPIILAGIPKLDISGVDAAYNVVLDATAKFAAKSTYLSALKSAKDALINIRRSAALVPSLPPVLNTDDLAPDFSTLAGSSQMRDILTRRWNECAKCVKADAHLAAIVMMGGLLEALFVAREQDARQDTPDYRRERSERQGFRKNGQLSGMDA